jgi:TolB protein
LLFDLSLLFFERNLTNEPESDVNPAWSPDGKRLLFTSGRGVPSGPQLYMMNADGSDPHPITPKKGWENTGSWSPDGSVILFECDREDSPGNMLDVCQSKPDGTGEKRVLFHRGHDWAPVVSPDGKRIAFTATSDTNHEIYLMNSDGSGLLRLTRHPGYDGLPRWSPDGKKLIFVSNRAGKFALYEIVI